MSTLAWIIVNIALLGSAVTSVKLAKDLPKELKTEQQQLLEKEKPNLKKPKENKEGAKDVRQAKSTKQASPEQTPPPIRTGSIDDIWKKSLFNPDRTEMQETENVQSNPDEPINNTELELSAILQLGDKAVAVIKQKQQQRGRGGRPGGGFQNRPGMPQFGGNNMPGGGRFGGNNMPGGGRMGGMPGMPPWMQQQQQQAELPKPQGKKIFRVGDTINDTGYTVKEIIPAERTCVVTRNGRDEVLTMEFADSQSDSRKQEAVNYQKEVIAKAEAAARQNTQNNNQNNQNRWGNRRGMMGGPGGMGGQGMWRGPGGMGGPGMMGGPGGGMMGGPGMWRGGQGGGQGGAPGGQSNPSGGGSTPGGGSQGGRSQGGSNRGNFNGNFQPWSMQRR